MNNNNENNNNNFEHECLYSFTSEEPIEAKFRTKYKGKETIEIESSKALAILLIRGIVFINSSWWEEEWPEEARSQIGVHVNCNDIFAWGCADAETLLYKELDDLFNLFIEDEGWGSTIWCIKKRGYLPQLPVYEMIQNTGKWDLKTMGLEDGIDGSADEMDKKIAENK